jgi:hypothetical protein
MATITTAEDALKTILVCIAQAENEDDLRSVLRAFKQIKTIANEAVRSSRGRAQKSNG